MTRRLLVPVATVAVAVTLIAGAISYTAVGTSSSAPSAYRTVETFVDGFNHGDFRASCSVTLLQGRTMAACEAFYVNVTFQGLNFGVWGGYKVVPGSAKVWKQTWRGKTVELAVVQFRYAAGGNESGQVLTAHLRKNKQGRWRVWFIA